MNQFAEYAQHGWNLCLIPSGTKGPRSNGWNSRENACHDPVVAEHFPGAGLCHAYSGTCALDVDRFDEAAPFLKEHGIDLQALFDAPDAVQISSGRTNRGKLLYALATPLPSKSVCGGAFELRCASAAGRSVQDVLPPTIHPETGKPYQWIGDWRTLPPIPPALLALWQSLLTVSPSSTPLIRDSAQVSELRSLLVRRDASCGYDEWIKTGMALHHETGGSDEGLALWDEWSVPSDKYPGLEVLQSHWASFGNSGTPITVDYLRRSDKASPADFNDVSNSANIFDSEEPKPPSGSFEFLSLVDLFKRPEPEWIIKGILPEAAFGAIYGQHSAGKTFVEVDLSLTIALGGVWRGRQAKQGRILIVAAEDDRGVQMRLAAGLAARGVQDAPIRVLPAAPVLTDKAHAKALLEAIKREEPPSIVFFDTLAAVTPGADENASKDMGELISYCYKIHKATGALVMLVHHEGKTPGRGMRGSSTLPGASDVLWEVSKDEAQHEMRIAKLKNAVIGDAYQFRLQPIANTCIVEWI